MFLFLFFVFFACFNLRIRNNFIYGLGAKTRRSTKFKECNQCNGIRIPQPRWWAKVTRETNITTEVEVETEAAVEDKAEAATVRVKTNITIPRIHNKINVIKVASNNMAITNKRAPREQTLDQKVETKKTTVSSSNNNRISFSFHKLTFPTSTTFKVKRERTSSVTVSIPPSNRSMETKLPESSLECSWTSPPLTLRSFSQTTLSSWARSTRPTTSTWTISSSNSNEMGQRQMTQASANRTTFAMRCKQISPKRVPSSEAETSRMCELKWIA